MRFQDGIIQASKWVHDPSPGGKILRCIFFLTLYGLSNLIWSLLDSTVLSHLLLDPIHEWLSFFITHACCFLLHGFYPSINVTINHTLFIEGKPTITMFYGCTGLGPLIRLSFILAFYPLPWRKKLFLWPFSLVILIFAATLHFLLLIPVAYKYPEWYSAVHDRLMYIIYYAFFFLCWLLWERTSPLRVTN